MDERKELEEIKAQITTLAEKAQALEHRIKARGKKSLLSKPEPGSGQPYGAFSARPNGVLEANSYHASISDPEYYEGFALFQSEDLVDNYARAFNTFLQLRHQPGTVPAKQDALQWSIKPEDDFEFVTDKGWWNLETKLCLIFPCFEFEADAQRAIEAIGKEDLAHMIKTFGHYEEGA